jgi:cyclopropane-fatty-acyl-phospholipid synthase
MRFLHSLLDRLIQRGVLRVYDHTGQLHLFGGTGSDPVVTIRIHDKSLYTKLFLKPELSAAEAYMDGELTFEEGSTLLDFLTLMVLNRKNMGNHPVQKAVKRIRRGLKRFNEFNPISKARDNAAHHYDLSEKLYRLFLDEDMQYTCAYFHRPNDTLEQAQLQKKRRIAAKLEVEDGMEVLDIGCGWGGLALYLAQVANVQVTGISLAKEQLRVATARADKMGLSDRVKFVYRDYREVDETFDRVVSIGMMEAVGAQHLDDYFGKVRDMLKPGGRALIHSIGRQTPPGSTNAFIQKYIFPGGYVPALSESFASVERVGLWVGDCEIWRMHYYYTIMNWRERFLDHWNDAKEIYDERFCRMWEFYLTGVALGFRYGHNFVFHLLLGHEREDIPICRDFIAQNERMLIERGL